MLKGSFFAARFMALVMALVMTLHMSFAYSQTPYTVAYNETTAPLVPLIDAVYAEMGIDAVFELVPSERAINFTDSGHFDADVSRVASGLEGYPNLLPTKEPIREVELYSYVRLGVDIDIADLGDLNEQSVQYIRGSKIVEVFVEGAGIKAMPSVSADSFYRMLEAGRFDIALISTTQLLSQGERLASLARRVGPVLASSPSYHLLNRRNAHLIDDFDAVLRAMKADGRFSRLLPSE